MQLFNLNLIISLLITSTTLALPVQQGDRPEASTANIAHLVKRSNYGAPQPGSCGVLSVPVGTYSATCTCAALGNDPKRHATIQFSRSVNKMPASTWTQQQVRAKAMEQACDAVKDEIQKRDDPTLARHF